VGQDGLVATGNIAGMLSGSNELFAAVVAIGGSAHFGDRSAA
jgi:hypothetical protein